LSEVALRVRLELVTRSPTSHRKFLSADACQQTVGLRSYRSVGDIENQNDQGPHARGLRIAHAVDDII
jgi:hypothetical protein